MTAPNCTGEEISFELDRFNKAVKKLFKRRNVAHFFKGCIRKLEVTQVKSNIFLYFIVLRKRLQIYKAIECLITR
ncbi:protein rep [Psychrobacillus sp. MER TA 171]|nr:protein rep [Psychrobacillus sp. MER TA 171]